MPMHIIKRVHGKVEHFLMCQLVGWIARLLYIAGLTMLIPIVLLFKLPHTFAATAIVATLCIFASFKILQHFTQSKRRALLSLGQMTLIPALLALVFAIAGRSWLHALFGFTRFESEVEKYLLSFVPSAWLVTLVYLVLGLGLILWSRRLK